MKLKELKIGNETEAYNKKDAELEVEKINKYLKELHYYKHCDKEKDEECKHHHCVYSVVWLGREDGITYTCGRRDK